MPRASNQNVLFLTQVLPYPLVGGAKIRAYYMLRQLSRQYDVTLVSFSREDDCAEHVSHLRNFCKYVYTVPMMRSRRHDVSAMAEALLTRQPAVIIRDRSNGMRSVLRELVNQRTYDIIHADQTSMAQYGLYARSVAPNHPRIILDQHNALYLVVRRQAQHENGFRRFVWRREARSLAQYERILCREYDHVLTVTEEDKVALLALFDAEEAKNVARRFTTIPICIDPDERPMLALQGQQPHILHLGTMFWPPNIEAVLWFANEVMPHVLPHVPDAIFTIAGKNPPAEVQALGDQNSRLAGHINVTGFVPDPTPLLARSWVFVVPLHAGGGMRVKILDAWLWGLPIVSTTIGAEGIDIRPGQNILIADEPETFANAVVQVMTDSDLSEALRNNGREWAERRYHWRSVYGRVSEVYNHLLAQNDNEIRRIHH